MLSEYGDRGVEQSAKAVEVTSLEHQLVLVEERLGSGQSSGGT